MCLTYHLPGMIQAFHRALQISVLGDVYLRSNRSRRHLLHKIERAPSQSAVWHLNVVLTHKYEGMIDHLGSCSGQLRFQNVYRKAVTVHIR